MNESQNFDCISLSIAPTRIKVFEHIVLIWELKSNRLSNITPKGQFYNVKFNMRLKST